MKKIILLVDDENIIRLTSGEILEELGFDVIIACTGSEGLEIFNKRYGEISLVILDMTLPDISGIEVFQKMKKISSNMKFLLTSGYKREMTDAVNEVSFIQKPYTIEELSNSIDALIG